MFCEKCGTEMQEGQKICSNCGCGKTDNSENSLNGAVLIRRAEAFTQSYDVVPDFTGYEVYLSKIDEFNPLIKINEFPSLLIGDLMAFTNYAYSRDKIEEIILKDYLPIAKTRLLSNLRIYFVEKIEAFIKEKNGKFVYENNWSLELDIATVYRYSRYFAIVCCEMGDWEGLKFAKQILELISSFKCKVALDSTTREINGLRKGGQVLYLSQFADVKKHYDGLMEFILSSMVRINPDASQVVEEEKRRNADTEKEVKQYNKKSVLTRILCSVAILPVLYLEYIISSACIASFNDIHIAVVICVGAVLGGLALAVNAALRNSTVSTIITVVLAALFLPLCFLVSAFFSFLSKIIVFILFGIVLLFVFVFHGDRTNP